MKIDKLDFREFHPLDHNIFNKDCRKRYGGIGHHLSLWWDYQMMPTIWKDTLCKIGLHAYEEFENSDGTKWMACVYCFKDR